ncbi:MAG: hypothetical protein WBG37_03325 [Desulfobacterales bacterium]
MEEIFKDLMEIREVIGVVLRSSDGRIQYQTFCEGAAYDLDQLQPALDALKQIQEADVVFTHLRLYLRQTQAGQLLVVMARGVPIAMVRLHCDMIIPRLSPPQGSIGKKKLWGLFKS